MSTGKFLISDDRGKVTGLGGKQNKHGVYDIDALVKDIFHYRHRNSLSNVPRFLATFAPAQFKVHSGPGSSVKFECVATKKYLRVHGTDKCDASVCYLSLCVEYSYNESEVVFMMVSFTTFSVCCSSVCPYHEVCIYSSSSVLFRAAEENGLNLLHNRSTTVLLH